ncbi:hypothetical protein D9M68_967290 [compost metagenome]
MVAEVAATLRLAQPRIEILPIKVEQIDGMTTGDKRLIRFAGDACGKAVFKRVGKHEQNAHRLFPME